MWNHLFRQGFEGFPFLRGTLFLKHTLYLKGSLLPCITEGVSHLHVVPRYEHVPVNLDLHDGCRVQRATDRHQADRGLHRALLTAVSGLCALPAHV